MKRTIFLTLVLVVALSASVALGDNDKVVQRVPAGAVAFHWVGNLTFPPGQLPELVGYIAFIEGVQGPFFSGSPGAENAYFTVRLDSESFPGLPIDLPVEPDSADYVVARLFLPGWTWGVYFNETPNQDWNDLDTFSDGERVASFEESAVLSTQIVNAEMGYNLFSSRLISSKSFWFNGQKVDFKKLVPNGVTMNNVTSQHPTNPSSFTSSAVAIGGRGWRDGGDDDD